MRKTSEKISEFSKGKRIVVIGLVVMVVLSIATALYLNTDFHNDRVYATNIKNNVSAILITLEEESHIKNASVSYDEDQDRYIIEASFFKLRSDAEKAEVCREISSCLGDETNFTIIAGDKEYYCEYAGKIGFNVYADGKQIYSAKEKMKYSSTEFSSSDVSNLTKSNETPDYDVVRPVKTEKTCQWAGCYNDRETSYEKSSIK